MTYFNNKNSDFFKNNIKPILFKNQKNSTNFTQPKTNKQPINFTNLIDSTNSKQENKKRCIKCNKVKSNIKLEKGYGKNCDLSYKKIDNISKRKRSIDYEQKELENSFKRINIECVDFEDNNINSINNIFNTHVNSQNNTHVNSQNNTHVNSQNNTHINNLNKSGLNIKQENISTELSQLTKYNNIKNINNLEFLFMRKMKNVLDNISKLSKKINNLDKKVNNINKNTSKAMNRIHTKLDMILEKMEVKEDTNIEMLIDEKIHNDKIRSHKLEEYGFYN